MFFESEQQVFCFNQLPNESATCIPKFESEQCRRSFCEFTGDFCYDRESSYLVILAEPIVNM